MGELASGVAHEIRNPLNTIGTIVQQLDKDFEPSSNNEEFHSLAGLVYKEVKRINETIQSFLSFARPDPVNPSEFEISEFISQIEQQYRPMLNQKSIQLSFKINWNGRVFWDMRQMKQTFMNLIQNSFDAIKNGGSIVIIFNELNKNEIEILFMDSGSGISPENINKIFSLYYTTKAKGSGIGLSLVQRIIFDHNGLITVDSREGEGTTFAIRLPKRIN